jgi:hypothetical protein
MTSVAHWSWPNAEWCISDNIRISEWDFRNTRISEWDFPPKPHFRMGFPKQAQFPNGVSETVCRAAQSRTGPLRAEPGRSRPLPGRSRIRPVSETPFGNPIRKLSQFRKPHSEIVSEWEIPFGNCSPFVPLFYPPVPSLVPRRPHPPRPAGARGGPTLTPAAPQRPIPVATPLHCGHPAPIRSELSPQRPHPAAAPPPFLPSLSPLIPSLSSPCLSLSPSLKLNLKFQNSEKTTTSRLANSSSIGSSVVASMFGIES